MRESECCDAPIIHTDICKECKEHTTSIGDKDEDGKLTWR